MQLHRQPRTDRTGLRARVYRQFEPAAWRRNGLSPLNKVLFVLISGAVLAAILETEPMVADGHDRLFDGMEWVLSILFSAEYLGRLWVAPDKFGSIPRAMWWATATLTTIGYGDVYPITTLGKICAACSAIAGIGLVAMPTGIMAAAFSEAVQRHSTAKDEPPAPPLD